MPSTEWPPAATRRRMRYCGLVDYLALHILYLHDNAYLGCKARSWLSDWRLLKLGASTERNCVFHGLLLLIMRSVSTADYHKLRRIRVKCYNYMYPFCCAHIKCVDRTLHFWWYANGVPQSEDCIACLVPLKFSSLLILLMHVSWFAVR